jgi:hypothetical protein
MHTVRHTVLAAIVRAIFAAIFATMLTACGPDNDHPAAIDEPIDDGSSNKKGSDKALCNDYCTTRVDDAPGCERYNENTRCERICAFYLASVCKDPYRDYSICMQGEGSAECAEPENGANGGPPILMVLRCHAEYDAWNLCILDKNASYCPY